MDKLIQTTGGLAAELRSMHVNLHFDDVQPFDKGLHSTGVLSIQALDVEARDRGKSGNVAILAVIPGPKKPSVFAPYLFRAIDELVLLSKEGMKVKHCWRERSPRLPGGVEEFVCDFELYPLLWAVLADTPARIKMCRHAGVGAYIGSCPFCVFEGVYVRNVGNKGGCMRYLGFFEPVVQRIRSVGNTKGWCWEFA